MTQSTDLSRRRALQFFAGAPLLPLASGGVGAALLGGCGGGDDAPSVRSVAFTGMAAPALSDPAAMATTSVASSMVVTYSDNSSRSFALAYEPFFITGAAVPDGRGGTLVAGGYYDIHNQPITDATDPGARQFFSDAPDGMSLLTLANPAVPGVTGNTVFAVVQFEYTTRNVAGTSMYGQLPSQIAVLTLNQDKASGKLTLVKYHNVDTSGVHGLWITCGASLSPWNTHLSSEEYEPDPWNTSTAAVAQFQGFSTRLFGNAATANPYHYGHLPEVTVKPDGTGSIVKHFCLGRISHELVQVMPDERTVLMGDDATNGGLFMFIADAARDLSAGTLYVARWTATRTTNGGAGTLKWIKLGHATSAEIKALVDGGIRHTDILDVKTADPLDASYTAIAYSGATQWVKLLPGQDKAAAFLETHRYAALKGGSMAFTKMEGTTVNVKDKIAYSAMSAVRSQMRTALGLDKVINAGAVYALNLAGSQSDSDGAAIDSAWVPVDMAPVPELIGEDLAVADALGNTANAEKLGNPDNLKFSEKLRTLFIGEDSGMHVNNFLWAYNVDTKALTRLLSCPVGAESTGLHAVDQVNGFTYIASNFQHPGDWEAPLHDIVRPLVEPLINANYNKRFGAAVGYLAGIPQVG